MARVYNFSAGPAVLPEEVGSVLTPMPLNKISFERSNAGDTNTIADAEQNLFKEQTTMKKL